MKKIILNHQTGKNREKPVFLTVYSVSLGCPKNRVDTERLLGKLNHPVQIVDRPDKAKLIFINTCAFIEPAVRESLRTIFDTLDSLVKKTVKPLFVVAGCLPGRYGIEELKKEIPEVDLWLDSHDQKNWAHAINNALKLPASCTAERFITSPSYLWLKIGEGCRHRCTFCTIPSIKGPLCSEPADALIQEVKKAIAKGISEVDLIAQDVTAWGMDFRPEKSALSRLITMLSDIAGLKWLRLLYLYPGSIDNTLLKTMALGKPILPYFDIPFQHSEKNILKSMGRPVGKDPRHLIEKIRRILPDAALRATFMVGFPGETEEDFKRLCNFVQEIRFYHLGVFIFQPEEGTAAADMTPRVPAKIAEERKNELMRIQANISREILAEYVDKKLDVLVDAACNEMWPGLHKGRAWFQAPEVDGITYISGPGVNPGKLVPAEIVSSEIYDLSALA